MEKLKTSTTKGAVMTIEEKKARLLRLSEKVTEEWLKEQMD